MIRKQVFGAPKYRMLKQSILGISTRRFEKVKIFTYGGILGPPTRTDAGYGAAGISAGEDV